MKKLAVLFPGIGYHCDKPLLYYSKKCLSAYGYEIIEVNYKHFPHMKDKDELIKQAEDIGYAQTEEILKDIPFSTYDEILFVSKSIGTAISARFNEEHHVNAYSIYFTPLVATFKYSLNGIAFHGTNDPWAKTNLIQCACDEAHIPLILYRDANHSLECGDVLVDISNLHDIFLHVIEAIQTVYPLHR